MVLFSILQNGTTSQVLDITPFIIAGSYNVSTQPEYDEWVDGWRTLRRTIRGWKLRGSFKVKFFSLGDYNNFLDTIENNILNGGYVYATVYDTKTKQIFTTYVFIDYDPSNMAPLVGRSDNEEFDITITQRNVMLRSEIIRQQEQEMSIGDPPAPSSEN